MLNGEILNSGTLNGRFIEIYNISDELIVLSAVYF
jgi:hypothetical protein